MARAKAKAKATKKVELALSDRGEACGSCGQPLFVCPGTVRVFVRCCRECTHRTQLDVDHEDSLAAQERQRKRQRRRRG